MAQGLGEGRPGRAFSGLVGQTIGAGELAPVDRAFDAARFGSEGIWAFCRFESEELPAVRMGFQRGAFNIGADERPLDPERLQLHLEVMTGAGGQMWLPSGRYSALALRPGSDGCDQSLEQGGRGIFSISGWPDMDWSFRSEEGGIEVRLRCSLRSVTFLPDCVLPRCVFAMWAATGPATAAVRVGDRTTEVAGWIFLDRPRILSGPNAAAHRRMYLYTTLHLEDGSSLLGDHAVDDDGLPIPSYCFGVHVDPTGAGSFLADARVHRLDLDGDGIPRLWSFAWAGQGLTVEAGLRSRCPGLARVWGGDFAPRSRAEFVWLPLVTEGEALITSKGKGRRLRGSGLTEYYDAGRA